MYECSDCGHHLDDENRCTNRECGLGPPPPLCAHTRTGRGECAAFSCRNYLLKDPAAPVQHHCSYCEYTAGSDEICDDDECPSHAPLFHQETCSDPGCETHGPVLPYLESLPEGRLDDHNADPPGWMITGGLMFPDGRLTPAGKRNLEWLIPRLPEGSQQAHRGIVS